MRAYFNNVIAGDNVLDLILGIGQVHEVRGTGNNTEVHVIFWVDKPSFKGLTPVLRHLCVYDKDGVYKSIGSTKLNTIKSQTLFYTKDIKTSELDMSEISDNKLIEDKGVFSNLFTDTLEVKVKSGIWLDSKFIYPNILEEMLNDIPNNHFRETLDKKKKHNKVWDKYYTKIIEEDINGE